MRRKRLLTLTALPIALWFLFFGGATSNAATTLPPTVKETLETVSLKGFADLVTRVKPAVVNISTRSQARAVPGGRKSLDPRSTPPRLPGGPADMNEFMRRFFDSAPTHPRDRARRSLGSGFLIDAQGLIVTNRHVIKDASEITVVLDDGRSFPAVLQGEDDKTDLALLKINAANGQPFPYVEFGDSSLARVGDWVLAIGNPFGLGGTTTSGIISARGRNINSGPYDDYIQVDAPINQGNSGGPLFNTKGKVIGVNTAIFSPNGGNVGIGFAIPANVVTEIVTSLQIHGKVQRAWLGIQIQPVTPAIAESFNRNEAGGVLVSAVNPDSPAARAGIEIGDIIMSFNDIETHRPRQLQHQVVRTLPGTEVDIVVWRESQNIRLTTTVTLMPTDMNMASTVPALTEKLERWGIELATIDDDARRQHQISASTKGVLIQHVATNSPGERKGLQAGDVIMRIGTTVVITPGDVINQITRARNTGRRAMVFLILRQHATRFVPFKLA